MRVLQDLSSATCYLHFDVKACYEEFEQVLLAYTTLTVESSLWRCGNGEMDIVTSALVLLCIMKYTFFFTVKICLCALSERKFRSFLSLLLVFLWRPLTFRMPCLLVAN